MNADSECGSLDQMMAIGTATAALQEPLGLAGLLGPTEVGLVLGVSAWTAQRLLVEGEIESMRMGPTIWRTTAAYLQHYMMRKFAASRCRPEVRMIEQTIVCMQELKRLGCLTADQQVELNSLIEQHARVVMTPNAEFAVIVAA